MTKALLVLAVTLMFAVPNLTSAQDASLEDVLVPAILEEAEFRPWVVAVHYSPFDLVLPSKIGGSIIHRDAEKSQWEIEYSHGSLTPFIMDELGKFTEDRYSLLRRFTQAKGVGFQWFYGAFYQHFRLHIGHELMSRLSSGAVPSADLLSVSSLGTTLGLGYRWLIKDKFVLGLDAAWSQPWVTTQRESKFLDVVTNADDRDKVETGMRVMEYFPRFVVAKISAGYSF